VVNTDRVSRFTLGGKASGPSYFSISRCLHHGLFRQPSGQIRRSIFAVLVQASAGLDCPGHGLRPSPVSRRISASGLADFLNEALSKVGRRAASADGHLF